MDELIEAYRQQLLALLPRGLAWNRSPDGNLNQWLTGVAVEFARADQYLAQLFTEADPRQTSALLPEWEASLGLPDRCTSPGRGIEARRASVVTKYTDLGGARVPRYICIAESLGYTGVSIKRFVPYSVISPVDVPLCTERSRFCWELHVAEATKVTPWAVVGGVNEPLSSWGDAELECVIRRESPAISNVIISYGNTHVSH
ncbi:YmfQ family protein [Jeongeupia chitinilytica]|uniref:Tail protein n=1 Tax=Jeongeupia chitinilytica TaxID=1041641 RepID=A0ABQ3GZL3_9NEIS|nr:putative phage tail protein [Jeongeupia chitinilytica]GHD60434.1 tail protein [Jeongeupia chitinilytica]